MLVRKVDLESVKSAYCCISEHSSFSEGLPESRQWFKTNLEEHVEGYHLLDKDKVVGHIYYAPSEKALLYYKMEPGVACVYCTWLNAAYLRKGYGRMMFDRMKDDLRSLSMKGIMVPATDFKEWMHYELFLKQGFQTIKEHPPYRAMYFPLTQGDIDIEELPINCTPSKTKVEITLFKTLFCPVSPVMYRRIKKVAQSFGDRVKISEFNGTLQNLRKYGTLEPLINGKIKLYGPASEEDVMKAIEEEIFELSKPQ